MQTAFQLLLNDPSLNDIIDDINDNMGLCSCHGRYHAMYVVDTVEFILTSLSYDEHIIQLGKIAGLLHDIGNVGGKAGHAEKSAIMCVEFLDKTLLSKADKNTIIQAIADHSDGDNIVSAVGAALLIADKSDVSKNRWLPDIAMDPWHEDLLEFVDVDIRITDKTITINYIKNPDNSKNSVKLLYERWPKSLHLTAKACSFLKRECIFEENGIDANIRQLIKQK